MLCGTPGGGGDGRVSRSRIDVRDLSLSLTPYGVGRVSHGDLAISVRLLLCARLHCIQMVDHRLYHCRVGLSKQAADQTFGVGVCCAE